MPNVELVQALHDYTPTSPTCLTLACGDIIQVYSKDASGWWDGICNGKRGWFPSNFVASVMRDSKTTDRDSSDYSESPTSSNIPGNSPASSITTPTLSPDKQSGTNFCGTSQDLTPPPTWDELINDILTVISQLNHAAKNGEKSKFTPYTNAVAAAVRRMFLCSGNLSKESPVLAQNTNLRRQYLAIRSALSKLRLACFISSGLWPPPDAVNKMRFQAGQVLLSIRHFVSAAQDVPIELYEPEHSPMTKSQSWVHLLEDDGTKFCDAEIMVKINQSSDSIVSHVAVLVGRISQERRTSGALIEKAKDIVNEVGQLLSLLEDIRLADDQSKPGTTSVLPDFLAKKDTLYMAVNDIVTTARTTMDAFAPPNALTLLMASATAVLKAVEELVVSAKRLIGQREGMELHRLQVHVELMDNEEKGGESDLGVLQRRAMSLTLLNAPENGNASDSVLSSVRTTSPADLDQAARGSTRNVAPQPSDSAQPQKVDSKSRLITQRSATNEIPNRSVQQTAGASDPSLNTRSKTTSAPNLAAYLDYEYGPNDVTFNLEGQVNGATFQALVERLTLHDKVVDPEYLNTFLLTFRCFATPLEFVNELIRRYSLKPPEGLTPEEVSIWTEKKLAPIRLRVFNAIKAWLESFYYETYDQPVLEPLQAFAAGPMSETLSSASSRILELVQRKKDPETTTAISNIKSPKMSRTKSYERFDVVPPIVNIVPQGPPPTPVVPKNFTSRSGISLLDIDPLEIARQITIMESRYYCAIRPCELINQEFSKKGSTVAVNVKAMSTISTQLTGWVAETILRENDTKKRCGLIKHFIKLSDRCLTLQNFNALMAVLCALNSSTIARLKKTWELLGKGSKASLENLRKATEHTRNYAEYRNRLKTALPPCLPFLGLYLTDLTFTDDGNPKYRGGPGSKLVNFDKYTKSARIVHEIQRFQIPYNLTEVPEMQDYIRQNLESSKNGGDVSELYRVSLLIEPRQDDGMDARLETMLMREGFL